MIKRAYRREIVLRAMKIVMAQRFIFNPLVVDRMKAIHQGNGRFDLEMRALGNTEHPFHKIGTLVVEKNSWMNLMNHYGNPKRYGHIDKLPNPETNIFTYIIPPQNGAKPDLVLANANSGEYNQLWQTFNAVSGQHITQNKFSDEIIRLGENGSAIFTLNPGGYWLSQQSYVTRPQ